jgi:hypothetical protein
MLRRLGTAVLCSIVMLLMACSATVTAAGAAATSTPHAAASAQHVTTPPAPIPCTGSTCWYPPPAARWQYQLQGVSGYSSTGGINVSITAVPFTGGNAVHPYVFDIDLYVDQSISGNNSTLDTAAVNAIHAMGARAICYLDAGTWENWRPDAGQFPSSVLGRNNGWPGEKWLDIRQTSVLFPLMQARVQKCVQAGFDGVEWDNVDGYSNRTGFPLTASNQIDYNANLANMAHQAGLTVALKNDVEQLPSLAPYFDDAINEQCQQYSECDGYIATFISAGKAVFQVEYKLATSKFCAKANGANRNATKKSLDLFDTPWTPCR